MNTSALKYNPGLLRDEELLRTFVVRISDFEWVLEVIKANTHLQANQHILVVGPRGSGKTTLVARVAYEVRTNPNLSGSWYPVVFSEESYAVNSPGEFWLEVIAQIYNETGDSHWKQAHDDLARGTDDANLRERALGEVLDYADKLGKKLILIVENLNMLLAQLQTDDDWDLRHTLLNENRIMLLGTATSKFSELESIDRAWFDLFTTHDLKPLNTKDSETLWKSYTGTPAPLRQVQALRILTGGNPRLFRILSSFAVNSSFRELMESLTRLIDEHTEYFKGSLDSLAPLERKVFVALLERWDPADARDIATDARMDVSKASSLLLRLMEKGRVSIVSSIGRKRKYQAAERLFNIYYLMRRRGRPADRVRAVVRFMVQFYRDDSLVDTVARITREACSLEPSQRNDHYSAYTEVLGCALNGRIRANILQRTAPEFFQDRNAPSAVRRLAALDGLAMLASMPDALQVLKKAHDHKPGDVELELLLARVVENKPTRAGISPAMQIEQGRVWAWAAHKLHDLDLFQEGALAAEKAVEADPANVLGWQMLGELLWFHIRHDQDEKGRSSSEKQAEIAFRKAIDLDPKIDWCHRVLGSILREQRRLDEAEVEAKKALEIDDCSEDNWAEFGAIKLRQHDFQEAETALRKALKLGSRSPFTWGELGSLLAHTPDRAEEAISAYRHAIALDPKDSFSSDGMLRLSLRPGPTEGAFSAINDFLERFEHNPEAIAQAAWAIFNAGHRELFRCGIELLRNAITRSPNAWQLAHPLASLLGETEDWKNAFEAIQPAIRECSESGSGLSCITQFIIDASAKGHAPEALAILEDRGKIAALEPLVAGIQIYLGENPVIAQEILDVGKDVAKKIRDKMKPTSNNTDIAFPIPGNESRGLAK